MWPVQLDALSPLEIAQQVREEPALHAIDAHIKLVAAWRRCDGVGPGLLLSRRVQGHGGDKLAGGKGKALKLIDDELEVVALGGFGDALFSIKTCRKSLTRQGNSHFNKDEALKNGL